MTEKQKQRIEVLTSFCGYGNPETAEVFFMGIEEHDPLQCDKNQQQSDVDVFIEGLSQYPKREWTYKDISASKMSSAQGATERIQRKIYQVLFDDETTPDSEIFKNKIHCFNLYPLGANKQNQYPPHYNDCFGFDFKKKKDLYNYFEKDSKRNDILRSFIISQIIDRGKLLFAFGKESSLEVKKLLDIKFNKSFDEWLSKKNKKPSMIKWSDNKQVWLTGHPSYGWINSEVIEKITDIRRGNS